MRFTIFLLTLSFSILGFTQTQNSLHFDGTNDYVSTTAAAISGNAARTVEAWIKTSANCDPNNGGAQNVIVDMGNMATGQRFTMNILWNNALRLEVGGNGFGGGTPINDGKWHHVAAVYDPNATNKLSLYVDGSLDVSGNLTVPVNTNTTNNITIGKRIDNIRHFNGNIDEVRIWDVARSAAEIDSSYNTEICANSTNLKAYYRFNQGTAAGSNTGITSLPDKSGNAKNGTLNNFTLSGSTSNWATSDSIASAPSTDSSFNITACGSYTSPGGKTVNSSQIINETIANSQGCDSNLTITVTINPINFTPISISACDSFVTPLGTVKKHSEIFTETFTNVYGCDSFVQVLLTIHQPDRDTFEIQSCDPIASPDGSQILTSSGTYTDKLTSNIGCDSFVTYIFTLKQESYATQSNTVCNFLLSPGGNVYKTSGIYLDTIQNSSRCDSIITTHLVVNYSVDTLLVISTCDSFRSESGLKTWYKSGTYQENLTTLQNCDSIINYKLNLSFSSDGITRSDTTVCGNTYISPANQTVTEAQVIEETLPNRFGCDSTYSISIEFHKDRAPSSVRQDEDTLIAYNGFGKTYQWYNCDNANKLSNGKTAKIRWKDHSAVVKNFGVEITNRFDYCTDSICILPVATGSISSAQASQIEAYPNPTQGIFTIESKIKCQRIAIFSSLGQKILETNFINGQKIDLSPEPAGLYIIKLFSDEIEYSLPLHKQ